MSVREILHVVYDGRCAFCVRTLRISRALDVWGTLRFHDSHDAVAIGRLFPALRQADLDEAMYLVAEGGAIYRGFFAFRRMAWSCPLMWPLLPLFHLPGAASVGPRVYAWIARHRRHLGCRTDASEATVRSEARSCSVVRPGSHDVDPGLTP